MAGINKVILVGNLGRDPEVKTLETGAKYARFSLATTESYKDKSGERKDRTEWHNIICWRGLAEIAEKYLTKGNSIYLEGKIRTTSWEDNGQKRTSVEIVADTFTMLGSKNNGASTSEAIGPKAPVAEPAPISAEPDSGDDLPF